jgi:hypothetical protein
VETLLDAVALGTRFWRIVASEDGERIAASLCARGDCGIMGIPAADAVTGIYHSDDGGQTWTYEEIAGSFWPVAFTQDELLMYEAQACEESMTAKCPFAVEYLLWPSRMPVTSPDATGTNGHGLVFTRTGEPLWYSQDGRSLLRADGSVAVTFELPQRQADAQIGQTTTQLDDRRWITPWYSCDDPGAVCIGIFAPDGQLQRSYGPVTRFQKPLPANAGVFVVAGVPEHLIPDDGPLRRMVVPAHFDPATGELRLIVDPFLGDAYEGRDLLALLAVTPG